MGCGAQAIDADGRTTANACTAHRMVLYTDTKGCPPLAKERKRREKDGLGDHAHRQERLLHPDPPRHGG